MIHFDYREFDSPDMVGSGEMMNQAFLETLDQIREDSGVPMIVNSGYRTKEHNAQIYKSLKKNVNTNSSHLKGIAVDIKCKDSQDRKKLIFAALDNGITRIGVSKTFIHLDMDETKVDAIWIY